MRRQPRLTRSITAKVTQIDYEKMETRAGDQSVSEWARGVLLKEMAGPDPFQLALMEQFWSLRYILLNGLPQLATDNVQGAKMIRDLVEEADQRKAEKARAMLGPR
jgi:hypothetical protein